MSSGPGPIYTIYGARAGASSSHSRLEKRSRPNLKLDANASTKPWPAATSDHAPAAALAFSLLCRPAASSETTGESATCEGHGRWSRPLRGRGRAGRALNREERGPAGVYSCKRNRPPAAAPQQQRRPRRRESTPVFPRRARGSAPSQRCPQRTPRPPPAAAPAERPPGQGPAAELHGGGAAPGVLELSGPSCRPPPPPPPPLWGRPRPAGPPPPRASCK